MNSRRLLAGLYLCIGLVGLTATDAYAVAGKIVDAPPGVSLAGGSVELDVEQTDGTTSTVTFNVNAQGALEGELPANMGPNNTKDCRYRGTDGRTRNIRCSALIFSSGNMTIPYSAIASTGTAVSGEASYAGVATGFLRLTEMGFSGTYATALGGTSGMSQSNFATTSGSGDHLNGTGFNFFMRTFLPFQPHGIKLGGFFEFDQFFGLDGTSGAGVHHINPAQNDTNVVRTVRRAFGFGVTQVIPVGMGFSLDFHQGFAVVQQSIEGITDQSSGGGPTESFRKNFTTISPKLGASIEYQLPNWPISIRIASEFIYLPNAGLNGFANFSGSPFNFSSESQWMSINTAGIVIPLSVLSMMR
jgi:hypothetical protein